MVFFLSFSVFRGSKACSNGGKSCVNEWRALVPLPVPDFKEFIIKT